MTGLLQTETPLSGLLASAPERLPFDTSVEIRAFVLRRTAGNVLVYSTAGAGGDHEARAPGGIDRWYLNHWHEAIFAARVDAPLFVHEDDRARTEERTAVRASFSRRHLVGGDFEAIPIPGHTPGATAYLWNSGEHRMLFTGDSLMLSGDEWVAAVLASSDRAAYLESLALIRDLDFDVLVPWAARAGGPWFARTDPADRRIRIDAIIERVRGGADR